MARLMRRAGAPYDQLVRKHFANSRAAIQDWIWSSVRWPRDCNPALPSNAVSRVIPHPARLVSLVTLLTGVIALLSIHACRQGVPVLDPGSRPAVAAGTISGTVRASAGSSSIEGRTVEVVNVDTGTRERTTTNNAGGFTFKVLPGKYRVDVVLLDGETLVKRPGVIDVDRSDVDAHADFIIGTTRIVRPRFAAPRTDNGLGPPIA
jgi:hypothetical protein